jgi:outer membrane protein OmpA-like peptidoglycan-associated protein
MIIFISTSPEPVELEDHPLISGYPGSTLSRKDTNDFDGYNLVIGIEKGTELKSKKLEGKVTRLNYYNPKERSMLEIFKNYETALLDSGMEVLFKCIEKECGPGYVSSAWNRLTGITAKSGEDCRYLAGKIQTEENDIYVALMVGKRRHQIDIIEVKPMEEGLVTVSAEALAEDIDRTGHVSVYGIYFDFNKADLKPESKPALDEIAKLLKNRPDLKIFVVGHTDSVGKLDYNLSLSRDRADAVVKALVQDYGIDAARLDAHGVGPLAPTASNRTDAGRAKNRRVELVAR